MFVFLSKFLPLFVYPLGLACLFLFAALIFRKHERWFRTAVLIALAVLLIGSNRFVSYSLARSLEWRYLPSEELPSADAIVLLGGGTGSAQYPRPMVDLNSAGDRVIYAGALYKEGKAPHILLSGGTISWLGSSSSTPAEDMAQIMDLMDIPQDVLWLQEKSQNTYEDALYSAEILQKHGIDRVILVTSAMHMPRSVKLFEHQGIEVIPAPTDFGVTQSGWAELTQGNPLDLLVMYMPSVSSLSQTTSVLKEYFGLFVYHLRGWI